MLFSMQLFTAVVQTQQTVLAAVGEDAEFSCQLLDTKDVLQVTWQKISRDVETNVATYSKYYGQRVNDGFNDKLKFKYTGLQNCSIVIRNVTEQDEGCYHCLFNTYPEGSFTGRTCFQVYELHVDVRESNSAEEWVVSCSATGRPAPTVTLSQQDLNFSQYNTVSVSNTNATFTVTTTAVLSGSRKHSTQVGCAARVLSAPHREKNRFRLPFRLRCSDTALTRRKVSHSPSFSSSCALKPPKSSPPVSDTNRLRVASSSTLSFSPSLSLAKPNKSLLSVSELKSLLSIRQQSSPSKSVGDRGCFHTFPRCHVTQSCLRFYVLYIS
uniref:Ig-like domain-containing protein n=1 Tax=Maylandia zebra TaxID=106582 RepID=A0A3P9DUS3_9CICH